MRLVVGVRKESGNGTVLLFLLLFFENKALNIVNYIFYVKKEYNTIIFIDSVCRSTIEYSKKHKAYQVV